MIYPVKVNMPPAITRDKDKTWIVAGCMIQVPSGTTCKEMHKFVTYERPTYNDVKTWKIASSQGGSYTVRCHDSDKYTCECPGFKFYKNCKHIKEVVLSNESR